MDNTLITIPFEDVYLQLNAIFWLRQDLTERTVNTRECGYTHWRYMRKSGGKEKSKL